MKRFVLRAVTALPMLCLLIHVASQAGGKKDSPWKPILPVEAYKELSERSIKAIEASAKANDKGAREKINVEAAILVAYTLSAEAPNAGPVAQLRGAALAVGKTDLKKLTAFGSLVSAAPKALADGREFKAELVDLMEIFRGKAKGGEGIHADLQYQPKLAKLNGIEALIGALGAKKISNDNLAKIAKELPNLAYRTAVVGSITYGQAPEKGAEQWRELSLKMRDASIALAEAARTKNANGVFMSAQALESTCTACHSAFKNK